MCNPMLMAAAALAGGTGAQMYGQRQQASAVNRAIANEMQGRTQQMELERGRQQEFDEGRQREFQQVMDKTGTREAYDTGLQEAMQERIAGYEANAADLTNDGAYSPPATGGEMSASSSDAGNRVVQAAAARDSAQRDQSVQQQLEAKARLGSLGDTLLGFGLERQPHVANIEANALSAKRSAGMLPGELGYEGMKGQIGLNRAQQKGRTAMQLGQVLSSLGSAGMGHAAFAGAGAGAQPYGYFNVPGIERTGSVLPRGFM